MTGGFRPELQRDVQRLLGRCLLRLQQYERQMKLMLAHQELVGPVDRLEAQTALRLEGVSDQSLGVLVKRLFQSYVVVEGTKSSMEPDAVAPKDQVGVNIWFRIEMTEMRRAAVKTAIDELVLMRNELVHQLIERFDVWSDDGCAAAIEHLNRCYERIDCHYDELRDWAKNLDLARAEVATVLQSDALKELMFNGAAPDGAVDWPRAGIVRALRDAVRSLSTDGWTRLEDAKIWIGKNYPNQVPEGYRCRSWPDVLDKSKAFRLEYRRDSDGRKVAWFRELHT